MKNSRVKPAGWSDRRLQGVLTHYEKQTEDAAVREDAVAGDVAVVVPASLLPAVRAMAAKAESSRNKQAAETHAAGRIKFPPKKFKSPTRTNAFPKTKTRG